MRVEFKRSSLLKAVQTAAGVIPARSTVPALQNVRVSAEMGQVEVMATDLELAVAIKLVGADIKTAGSALWPAAKTMSILRECRDETVEFKTGERHTDVTTSTGKFKLPVEDVANFVCMSKNDAKPTATVKCNEMTAAIRSCQFAAKKEEGRNATMTGVLIDTNATGLTVVGTDGKRLSVVTIEGRTDGERRKMIVPVKAMRTLLSVLDDEGDSELRIAANNNFISFETERSQVASRLLEGSYPPYNTVIPTKNLFQRFVIGAEEFFSFVRQAAIMADDETRRITLAFETGGVTMSTQSHLGTSDVTMPIPGFVGQITMSFDPVYLTEFFRSRPTGEVWVELFPENRPIVFRSGTHLHLIVPLV